MNSRICALHHLTFAFDVKGPTFFKDITISFKPQALNFLKGKNGAGKSTLFKILQGKISPDSYLEGDLILDTTSYALSNQESNRSVLTNIISALEQDISTMLVTGYSAEQNLRCANMPRYPGLKALPEFKPLLALFEKFGINKDKPIELLSGGQRQLLALLMALQKPTKVLLLDEPTAALDEENAYRVMSFLQEIARQLGITVLIIEHDEDLIKNFAQGSVYELKVDKETGLRTIEPVNYN